MDTQSKEELLEILETLKQRIISLAPDAIEKARFRVDFETECVPTRWNYKTVPNGRETIDISISLYIKENNKLRG